MSIRSTHTTTRRAAWLALLVLLLAGPVYSATPREELLRLVPEDVGFCLVVQDLRQHSAAFLESPFAAELRNSALGKAMAQAPEMQKLAELEKQLLKHFNIGWTQLREDIFGDAAVFAYKPGPVGEPNQEQGLLLVKARNAQLLSDLLDRINDAQKKSGELKELTVREHAGQKYFQRVTTKETSYYFQRGPMLAFGTQEGILKRAIDLDRRTPAGENTPSPVAQQLRQLGSENGLASLWINPRAFEAELLHKSETSKGAEAAFLKNFLVYWRAVEGVGLFVTPGQDLEVGLTLKAKEESLPPAARRFFAEFAKPTELWSVFPDNALLAVAGRVDAPALAEMLGEFLTPETRKSIGETVEDNLGAALGMDISREILPYLGPDCGLCITAPDSDDKNWVPHMVAVLRVRPGKDGARVDQTVLSALNSFAMLAVLDHNNKNRDKMSLKTLVQDRIEVKYLVNDKKFPPGFQPAFALKGGYLVLASSPEAIRRFAPEKATPPPESPGADRPVVRMSLKDLRTYLQERKEPLTTYVAELNKITKDQANRGVEGLLMGLQLVDRLDIHLRSVSSKAALTLRVRPAWPLRK